MALSLTLVLLGVSVSRAHEYYSGRGPDFRPMEGWEWARFTGEWWAALKMNSRSSCIRYNYQLEDGER